MGEGIENKRLFISIIERVSQDKAVEKIYFGVETPAPPDRAFFSHSARMFFVLEGCREILIAMDKKIAELEVEKGQGCFLVPHAWWISGWRRPFKVFGVNFYRDYMRLWYLEFKKGQPRPPWRVPDFWYHTQTGVSGPGKHLVDSLTDLARKTDRQGTEILITTSLLRFVQEDLVNDTSLPTCKAQQTLRAIKTYLEQHCEQPIDRSMVADAFGIHPNYISTLFQRLEKTTFKNFMIGLQMERAQNHLKNLGLNINEVASRCGFNDSGYFNKVFKKTFGLSPGTYRRRYTKNAQYV